MSIVRSTGVATGVSRSRYGQAAGALGQQAGIALLIAGRPGRRRCRDLPGYPPEGPAQCRDSASTTAE